MKRTLLLGLVMTVGLLICSCGFAYAQTKTQEVAKAADVKTPTTVEFKASDAAQLALLRVRLGQLDDALKLVGSIEYPASVLRQQAQALNEQIGKIISSYKMDNADVIIDENGNWTGLKIRVSPFATPTPTPTPPKP